MRGILSRIAQLAEHGAVNSGVLGSSPSVGAFQTMGCWATGGPRGCSPRSFETCRFESCHPNDIISIQTKRKVNDYCFRSRSSHRKGLC
jgi:hypothetical protein